MQESPRKPSAVSCAGFHTFDYARHFMSCCSRMLGLEHVASRGSISIEYYGRDVGIKIMPTGVKPERFLNGFGWQDTIWRRGELLSQVFTMFNGDQTVIAFWHAAACTCKTMSFGGWTSDACRLWHTTSCLCVGYSYEGDMVMRLSPNISVLAFPGSKLHTLGSLDCTACF